MGRQKHEIPAYRFHRARNCGKATFGPDTVYFPGPFQSERSLESYRRAVGEWLTTGLSPRRSLAQRSDTAINVLIASFWKEHVLRRYVKNGCPTTERRSFATALRPVRELYGTQPIASFTPRSLIVCRQKLIEAGYTRKRINQHVGRIRRMFKWGVPRDLVPDSVWCALGSVEGLRPGEGGYEPAKVRPVPEVAIDVIRAFVTPPIWAMIQLQLWTGARPGEICQMRTCDIAAESDDIPSCVAGLCHAYRPSSHKTEHHGRDRVVLLGPNAWAILEPWLRPDAPETFLFSPAEARAWYFAMRRAAARTPRRKLAGTKPVPKRQPSTSYSVSSYGNAISRAIDKANRQLTTEAEKVGAVPQLILHWHPNQLRHNAATRLRAKYGIETARVILGHASASTTEIYAEEDFDRAARAMAESG